MRLDEADNFFSLGQGIRPDCLEQPHHAAYAYVHALAETSMNALVYAAIQKF